METDELSKVAKVYKQCSVLSVSIHAEAQIVTEVQVPDNPIRYPQTGLGPSIEVSVKEATKLQPSLSPEKRGSPMGYARRYLAKSLAKLPLDERSPRFSDELSMYPGGGGYISSPRHQRSPLKSSHTMMSLGSSPQVNGAPSLQHGRAPGSPKWEPGRSSEKAIIESLDCSTPILSKDTGRDKFSVSHSVSCIMPARTKKLISVSPINSPGDSRRSSIQGQKNVKSGQDGGELSLSVASLTKSGSCNPLLLSGNSIMSSNDAGTGRKLLGHGSRVYQQRNVFSGQAQARGYGYAEIKGGRTSAEQYRSNSLAKRFYHSDPNTSTMHVAYQGLAVSVAACFNAVESETDAEAIHEGRSSQVDICPEAEVKAETEEMSAETPTVMEASYLPPLLTKESVQISDKQISRKVETSSWWSWLRLCAAPRDSTSPLGSEGGNPLPLSIKANETFIGGESNFLKASSGPSTSVNVPADPCTSMQDHLAASSNNETNYTSDVITPKLATALSKSGELPSKPELSVTDISEAPEALADLTLITGELWNNSDQSPEPQLPEFSLPHLLPLSFSSEASQAPLMIHGDSAPSDQSKESTTMPNREFIKASEGKASGVLLHPPLHTSEGKASEGKASGVLLQPHLSVAGQPSLNAEYPAHRVISKTRGSQISKNAIDGEHITETGNELMREGNASENLLDMKSLTLAEILIRMQAALDTKLAEEELSVLNPQALPASLEGPSFLNSQTLSASLVVPSVSHPCLLSASSPSISEKAQALSESQFFLPASLNRSLPNAAARPPSTFANSVSICSPPPMVRRRSVSTGRCSGVWRFCGSPSPRGNFPDKEIYSKAITAKASPAKRCSSVGRNVLGQRLWRACGSPSPRGHYPDKSIYSWKPCIPSIPSIPSAEISVMGPHLSLSPHRYSLQKSADASIPNMNESEVQVSRRVLTSCSKNFLNPERKLFRDTAPSLGDLPLNKQRHLPRPAPQSPGDLVASSSHSSGQPHAKARIQDGKRPDIKSSPEHLQSFLPDKLCCKIESAKISNKLNMSPELNSTTMSHLSPVVKKESKASASGQALSSEEFDDGMIQSHTSIFDLLSLPSYCSNTSEKQPLSKEALQAVNQTPSASDPHSVLNGSCATKAHSGIKLPSVSQTLHKYPMNCPVLSEDAAMVPKEIRRKPDFFSNEYLAVDPLEAVVLKNASPASDADQVCPGSAPRPDPAWRMSLRSSAALRNSTFQSGHDWAGHDLQTSLMIDWTNTGLQHYEQALEQFRHDLGLDQAIMSRASEKQDTGLGEGTVPHRTLHSSNDTLGPVLSLVHMTANSPSARGTAVTCSHGGRITLDSYEAIHAAEEALLPKGVATRHGSPSVSFSVSDATAMAHNQTYWSGQQGLSVSQILNVSTEVVEECELKAHHASFTNSIHQEEREQGHSGSPCSSCHGSPRIMDPIESCFTLPAVCIGPPQKEPVKKVDTGSSRSQALVSVLQEETEASSLLLQQLEPYVLTSTFSC